MIRRQNRVSASDVQLPSVPSVPEGTKESSKEQMYAWQLTIYELVANRDIDLLKSTLQAIKESGYSLAPILNTPHGPRHARDEVSTALHQAAFYGYLDCVEVLVKEGAQCDIVNHKGKTAYQEASLGNKTYEKEIKAVMVKGAKKQEAAKKTGRNGAAANSQIKRVQGQEQRCR